MQSGFIFPDSDSPAADAAEICSGCRRTIFESPQRDFAAGVAISKPLISRRASSASPGTHRTPGIRRLNAIEQAKCRADRAGREALNDHAVGGLCLCRSSAACQPSRMVKAEAICWIRLVRAYPEVAVRARRQDDYLARWHRHARRRRRCRQVVRSVVTQCVHSRSDAAGVSHGSICAACSKCRSWTIPERGLFQEDVWRLQCR